MVDGRTVYSPLFAGVFWNMLDYVLEDIDRIEVIRGPGAALWGANAVNGVDQHHHAPFARHAGHARHPSPPATRIRSSPSCATAARGGAFTWRVYGKFADARRPEVWPPARRPATRDVAGRSGFRVDGGDAERRRVAAQGRRLPQPRRPARSAAPASSPNSTLQGRWSAPARRRSRVDVQSYYRREYRRVPQQLTHHIDVVRRRRAARR